MGQWVGALGGAGLLASMFLDWYSVDPFFSDDNLTGWQAFSVIDLFLAMAGVAGLSVGVVAATGLSVSYPVAGSAWACGAGLIALALIVFRLLDPPVTGFLGETDLLAGAWLGLVSSAAIVLGGILGMKELPPLKETAATS